MTIGQRVWTEDNGDGTMTTYMEDDEYETEIKAYDGTVVARHGGGSGTRSITVPSPLSSYSFTDTEIVARSSEPPNGWYPFGMHAGWDSSPHLAFSTERDDSGMPLWEKPVSQTADGLNRFLKKHWVKVESKTLDTCHCGEVIEIGGFDEHLADAWEKHCSGERL